MTGELVKIIERVKRTGRREHHSATQVFQALRIAVNQELQQLESFLETGFEILRPQARMAVISFHSLEDRIVKRAFRKWSRACLCPPRVLSCRCGWSQKVILLTKKPITPSADEIKKNPRARSAKMRVAVSTMMLSVIIRIRRAAAEGSSINHEAGRVTSAPPVVLPQRRCAAQTGTAPPIVVRCISRRCGRS
jgi:hypothetical protein